MATQEQRLTDAFQLIGTDIKNILNSIWTKTGNAGTDPATHFIGTTDNKPLVFRTNNVERFRILENGNFGIGTNNPEKLLTISGNNGSDFLFQVESPNNNANFLLLAKSSNQAQSFSFRSLSAGGNGWNIANNQIGNFIITSRNASTNTDRMVIFSNTGNVSINTTTDAGFRLDVNGSVRVGGGAGTAGQLQIVSGTGQHYPSLTWINNGGSVQGQILGYGGILYTQNTSNFQFMNINAVKVGGAYGGIITSSILQVDSTTKGFLPPRMTSAQRTAIVSPAVGLVVYQTDATEGLYVNSSTGWIML